MRREPSRGRVRAWCDPPELIIADEPDAAGTTCSTLEWSNPRRFGAGQLGSRRPLAGLIRQNIRPSQQSASPDGHTQIDRKLVAMKNAPCELVRLERLRGDHLLDGGRLPRVDHLNVVAAIASIGHKDASQPIANGAPGHLEQPVRPTLASTRPVLGFTRDNPCAVVIQSEARTSPDARARKRRHRRLLLAWRPGRAPGPRRLSRLQTRRARPDQERSAGIAPRGIRVNAVCPGTIETPMVADMLAKGELDMTEAIQASPSPASATPTRSQPPCSGSAARAPASSSASGFPSTVATPPPTHASHREARMQPLRGAPGSHLLRGRRQRSESVRGLFLAQPCGFPG